MQSRILKFRVWDKLNKFYIYPDKGYRGHYILSLDGKFINLQNGSGGDEYVVQQYIGLKDKNNKEIYEGDLVKAKNGIVYTCKYSNEEAAFILDFIDSFVYLSDFDHLEVVGNIFENERTN